MDFRVYIYKMNKIMNGLIFKKIINFILLACLIVCLLLTKPYCIEWLNTKPLLLEKYELFDFSVKANLIYSSIWISIAVVWLFIWIACIIGVNKVINNIRDATDDQMTSAGVLKISNFLDLLCLGWIIVIATKKKIIMKAYNCGVDNWLNYSGY